MIRLARPLIFLLPQMAQITQIITCIVEYILFLLARLPQIYDRRRSIHADLGWRPNESWILGWRDHGYFNHEWLRDPGIAL